MGFCKLFGVIIVLAMMTTIISCGDLASSSPRIVSEQNDLIKPRPNSADKPKPKGEQPKPDEPRPEDPRPDEPRPEEPNPDEPEPEDPKPEQPNPDEPKPEDPKPEQPNPDEPKPEDPKPEQPKPDEPKPEKPKPEQPKKGPSSPDSPDIDPPHERKAKNQADFTEEEKLLEKVWFAKKIVFANTFVIAKRRELAAQYAKELNELTQEEFAFLTTQPFLWRDLFSVEMKTFILHLNPQRIKIAADAIANKDLRKLDSEMPVYIAKMYEAVDIDAPDAVEKLSTGLPAATVDQTVSDRLMQKARAVRQSASGDKTSKRYLDADALLKKIAIANKIRRENAKNAPKPPPEKDKENVPPNQKGGPKPKPQPDPPPKPQQEKEPDWAQVKVKFDDWLTKRNFVPLIPQNLADTKLFMRYLLKNYDKASPLEKPLWQEAFLKTMEQHSVVVPVFEMLKSVELKEELKRFTHLLPVALMDSLWRSEKELIIAGESVREKQRERLTTIFANMSDEQLKESMQSDVFWNILHDQSKAAIAGFSVDHHKYFAQYFISSEPAKKRIPGFATKVVAKLDFDEHGIDFVYDVLLAYAPVTKINDALQDTVTNKIIPLSIQLKKKYGGADAAERIAKLRDAMKK